MATSQIGMRRLYAANQTTVSIPTAPLANLAAKPSGDGYFGGDIKNHIVLCFIGTDANNETFAARASGVRRVSEAGAAPHWARFILFTLTGTLGQAIGVANTTVDETQFYADTLSVSSNTDVVLSPTTTIADSIATVRFDPFGYEDIYVEVATTGIAASVNCLASTF